MSQTSLRNLILFTIILGLDSVCFGQTKLYNMIYVLTAIGLTLGGSSTVHIYTQIIHRTTQLTTLVGRLSGIQTQSGQNKISNKLTA